MNCDVSLTGKTGSPNGWSGVEDSVFGLVD